MTGSWIFPAPASWRSKSASTDHTDAVGVAASRLPRRRAHSPADRRRGRRAEPVAARPLGLAGRLGRLHLLRRCRRRLPGRWQAGSRIYVERAYGRSHPMTVSGSALDSYAGIAGLLGGACFRQARRVPRLGRAALAFRCHPRTSTRTASPCWTPASGACPTTRTPTILTRPWSRTRRRWPRSSGRRSAATPTTSSPRTRGGPGCPAGTSWGRSSTASTPASGTVGLPGRRRRGGVPTRGDRAPGRDPRFGDRRRSTC